MIHRLDEFLPHLARLQPCLLDLLPRDERPVDDAALGDWVGSLPQSRMMEICSLWVLESLRTLRERSPLTNVLMRGALMFPGEFDVADAGSVAVGEPLTPGDPRRAEAEIALGRAARHGLLIHLAHDGRYCVPFPVRLALEGVEFLEPLERDEMRFRFVQRFADLATELARDEPDAGTHRHWRFPNILAAYETAVDMLEEATGLESTTWYREPVGAGFLPAGLGPPILAFADLLGRELVVRHSDRGERLLAAAVVAAGTRNQRLAAAYSLLAQFHLVRSRHAEALKFFERLVAIQRQESDQANTAYGLSVMAICLSELGQRLRAAELFVEANQIAREAGLHDIMVNTTNCGARLLVELGDVDRGITLLEATIQHMTQTHQANPQLPESHLHLGRAYAKRRELGAARTTLERAVALAKLHDNRTIQGFAYAELGRVHDVDNAPRAEEMFDAAIETFLLIGDTLSRAKVLLMRANSRLQRSNPDGIEALLETALSDARRANDREVEAAVWDAKVQLAEHTGDQRALVKALDNQIRALRHTRKANDLAEAHFYLGSIYLEQDAPLVAAMEYLRAQAIVRSTRIAPPRHLEEFITGMQDRVSPDEWEFLLRNVSEEIDTGQLIKT